MKTSVRRHLRRTSSGRTNVRQHSRQLSDADRGIAAARMDKKFEIRPVRILNKEDIDILERAYINDYVSTFLMDEKKLDRLLEEGYLENKHKSFEDINKKGYMSYWISLRGVNKLKKEGILKNGVIR